MEQIEHSGVVDHADAHAVYVKITSRSACGSCHARQACGMAESEEKIVAVQTSDAGRYAAGDSVCVGVRRGIGLRAVALAYVGALLVLLAVLVAANALLDWSEGVSALAAVAAVALYYAALRLFRGKIEHTIHFTITKI
ncbi:SoxR reducing system RseC family protein [Alistipes sp.]|uniref:SoxR reducing system RseC family protein n=1 Tax=Alistipes sp. TaxID=1872444 RepID=UPI0025BB8B89|nr:SoxR reducing system RseC family protein [Alistipes sp.]